MLAATRSPQQQIINLEEEEDDSETNQQQQATRSKPSLTSTDGVTFSCERIHLGGTDKDVPQARQCHSATFIEDREEMIVFGGRIRKTLYSDELCVFNLQKKQWYIHRNPRNAKIQWPFGRKLASLHYDKTANALYMFGGLLPSDMAPKLQSTGVQDFMVSSDGDIRQTDLWKFDFETAQWTCLSPRLPFVTPDEQHVLLQQSSDCFIVLGGQTMSHCLYMFKVHSGKWDVVEFGSRYAGKPAPDRLRLFSTVCRQNEMILFGGKHCDVQMMTNDIWTFNIQNYEWRKVIIDSKSATLCKRDRTMTALLQDDFLVVYGGRKDDGHLIGDSFIFSFIDKRWYKLQIENTHPGKVFNAVSVPIKDGSGMLMFGGHDGTKSLNCVYQFKAPALKTGLTMASLLIQSDNVLCADVVFEIESKEIACHSCFVSQIPYLRDLIQQERSKNEFCDEDGETQLSGLDVTNQTKIKLEGDVFKSKSFEQLLMFLYGSAPTTTSADEVVDLGLLASFLSIEDLFEWCVGDVTTYIDASNVFSIIKRCQSMQRSDFEDVCVSFIAAHPMLKMHEDIAVLPKETILKVLRTPNETEVDTGSTRVDPSIRFQQFLRRLRDEPVSTSDLTITTKGKQFLVHKVVLVFQSSYFATMFGGNFAEKSETTINLSEISSDTMARILDFVYNNDVDFTSLSESELMDLAKGSNMLLLTKLEVESMNELCMRASTGNAFDMLHFSRSIPNSNGSALKQRCLELVDKEDLVQHLFQFADVHDEMLREINELKRKRAEDSSDDEGDIDLHRSSKRRKVE